MWIPFELYLENWKYPSFTKTSFSRKCITLIWKVLCCLGLCCLKSPSSIEMKAQTLVWASSGSPVCSVFSVCQVYWVGPSMGGTLAAALYEYLFCPDPEVKKRETFVKTPFTAAKQRQDSATAQEPLFTVMDVERAERREREVSGEVLSSVWLERKESTNAPNAAVCSCSIKTVMVEAGRLNTSRGGGFFFWQPKSLFWLVLSKGLQGFQKKCCK